MSIKSYSLKCSIINRSLYMWYCFALLEHIHAPKLVRKYVFHKCTDYQICEGEKYDGMLFQPQNSNTFAVVLIWNCLKETRSLDESASFKVFISQPKHMLWVPKRTVSMRRFFWAHKTNVKTYGLENYHNFLLKILVYADQCIFCVAMI